MIKRLIHTIGTMAMMVLVFVACQDQTMPSSEAPKDVPEGYVAINFKLDVPDMREVQVRAVDPDGVDIHNIALYCFNTYGLYIGKVGATINAASGTAGTFTATIPEDTHIIHFLANQNTDLYDDNVLRGKSEEEVIAAMEGASGMLIFWGRVEHDSQYTDLAAQITVMSTGDGAKGVLMIRNQAMVTTTIGTQTYTDGKGSFTVTGFRTANIHAFGTVAPFCPTHGFKMTTWPCEGEAFVTLPVNKAMMSDITAVNTKPEDYVFEHENTLDNPVSVIIRGRHAGEEADKFYRVMLIDENGIQLLIRRNHKYTIKIVGDLSYGQDSFAEAMEAPATNNVYISVDAWVNEVEDAEYSLAVEKTSVVMKATDIVEGQELELKYTIKGNGGTTISANDQAEVTWLDGNTVAYHDFVGHTFTLDNGVGKGSVKIKLRAMTDVPQHVGTLMIRKGKLYRTIEVVVIHTQTFTPSWISAQVYGTVTGDKDSRENVTLKFTIPETCPESLFPLSVLISVNSLDVRSEAGEPLPVVIKGDPQYFGNDYTGIEYKYLYTAEAPGVQRVYFENILTHGQNDVQTVHLEANYFETLTKTVVYASHQRAITLPNLSQYSTTEGDGSNFAADEVVLYRLVPQKINAPVTFTMNLKDGEKAVDAGANDEFLLYSKTLNYYQDDQESSVASEGFDCTFMAVDEAHWSSNGRVHMFYPRSEKLDATPDGQYSIYLYTNTPKSEDVVRIASNTSLSSAYLSTNNDEAGKYKGNSYRSVIFELANYRPFRFAAQVAGEGKYQTNTETDAPEEVSELQWDYAAPGVQKDISFDITSFTGTDNQSVDPFGTAFEVYIDAPMLEIDESRWGNLSSKLKKDPNVEGRFIYTVDANRETEQTFGTAIPLHGNKVTETGERKVLPFKTKSITNSGTITISADASKVIYHSKTFRVTNAPITGTINYIDGNETKSVPKDAFVAFIRTATNARIGVMTITEDGKYSLNLRSEYVFDWTDKIELDYKVSDVVYECKTINNGTTDVALTLESLYNNKNVILTAVSSNTNP